MLLLEGLTQAHSQKKSLVAFWREFRFNDSSTSDTDNKTRKTKHVFKTVYQIKFIEFFKGVLWIHKLQLQYIFPLIINSSELFRKTVSVLFSDRKFPFRKVTLQKKKDRCVKSDIHVWKNLNAIKNNVGQEVLKGCEGAAFDSVRHPTSGQVRDMSTGQGSKSQIFKTHTSDRRGRKTTETQQTNSRLRFIYSLKGFNLKMIRVYLEKKKKTTLWDSCDDFENKD